MWLHKRAKLLTAKLISLKHHKIAEKHHEFFSRHLIFWKMLRCTHSKHSTSRVSNPKLWSLDLHAGQSLNDALWTAGYSPASVFTSVSAPTSVLIQDLRSKEELKVTWHCARKSTGYKDLRWSILMILSIAITERHELDCFELFCQNDFAPSYTLSPGTSYFHRSTPSWQANSVKCYESC